jgi:hypothetical protein
MNIFNDFNDVKESLKNRVLRYPSFSTQTKLRNFISLQDNIFLYNDGRIWKIIPLSVAQKFPIIHDHYFEKINDQNQVGRTFAMTISICPFTLFATALFGEFIPIDKVYNNNIVLTNKNNEDQILVPIINNLYSKETGTISDELTRKLEVRFMTLKNAITKYPDCEFIDQEISHPNSLVDSHYLKNDQIIYPAKNFSDKYHPKTIIYVIEYKSKKTGEYKYSLLVSKDVKKIKANKADIDINGFEIYLDHMGNKIREKGGLIYPCFWFAWDGLFPQSKLIKL